MTRENKPTAAAARKGRKVVVLGTGGTIAGTAARASDNVGYTAAQLTVESLAVALPSLAAQAAEGLLFFEQVAQIDSKDMGFAVWHQLAQRVAICLADEDVQGIVVTHGSDTLEETAYFLHLLLHPFKPVVLTCAMRPATALVPDGPQNLVDAIAVARHESARGVLAVCAGQVHGAQDVRKVHPYRINAFDSGDAGVLAYVEEGAVRSVRDWPIACPDGDSWSAAISQLPADPAAWPWVEIVVSHAGATPALARLLAASGVKGIVWAATGNGTLHETLEAAMPSLEAQDVRCVRVSRCPLGQIVGAAVSPEDQAYLGLSPVKARIRLMLELIGLPC
jgi:L-asparaginase